MCLKQNMIVAYLQHQIRIVIGTDSHARIDVTDEMRSLEDHERLRLQRRLVWLERADNLIAALTPVVCADGYASLGKGNIEPSDRVYIEVPGFLEDCSPLHVAQDWLIGGSSKDIRHVYVGAEQVIKDGCSTRIDEEHLHQQVNGLLKRLT